MKPHEVAHVVSMQVTGKHLVNFREVRPQGEHVRHRARSNIKQELVPIAQLNERADGCGLPGQVWHAATERGDSHLSVTQQFGIGKIAGWVVTVRNR